MFTFSGTIGRKTYALGLLAVIVEFFVVTSLLLAVMELAGGEAKGASTFSQAVAIIAFGLMIVNLIAANVVLISIVMRRARDIGNTALWTVLGLLFFPVTAALAFMPGNNETAR